MQLHLVDDVLRTRNRIGPAGFGAGSRSRQPARETLTPHSFEAALVENRGLIVLTLQLTLESPHVVQHSGGGLIPFVGILCQRLVDDSFQLTWHIRNKL